MKPPIAYFCGFICLGANWGMFIRGGELIYLGLDAPAAEPPGDINIVIERAPDDNFQCVIESDN